MLQLTKVVPALVEVCDELCCVCLEGKTQQHCCALVCVEQHVA